MITVKEVLKELNYQVNVKVPKKEKKKITNLFYWWRRFPIHKFLSPGSHILDKEANGDFNYSPYWTYIQYEYYWLAEDIAQIKNMNLNKIFEKETINDLKTAYNKRLVKLYDDYEADESARLYNLKNSLIKTYGGDIETVETYINEVTVGTIRESILNYRKYLELRKIENELPF
jgi:hypothetical protein